MQQRLLPRLAPLLLVGLAVCVTDRAACGQGATAGLYGNWEYDGDDLEILFQFKPMGKVAMWLQEKRDFDKPSVSGQYKIVSESRDEKSRPVVKIDLVWGNNAKTTHKVVITYHKDNRIEMAFNKEPLRYYNRVRR